MTDDEQDGEEPTRPDDLRDELSAKAPRPRLADPRKLPHLQDAEELDLDCSIQLTDLV